MSDPLLLLRAALSTNASLGFLSVAADADIATAVPVESLTAATHISFPPSAYCPKPTTLPKSTRTRYINAASLPATTAGSTAPERETLDLASLLFCYLSRAAPQQEYAQGCREGGIVFVSVIEKRGMLDWLTGKSDVEATYAGILPLVEAAGASAAVLGGQTAAGDSAVPPVAKKARYLPDRADQDKVKKLLRAMNGPSYGTVGAEGRPEKDVMGYSTRATVLRGDRLNNFDSARQLVASRLEIAREEQKLASQQALPGAGVIATTVVSAGKKKHLTPIILISPSSSALITMHNVKKFLQDSIFEPSEEARMGDGRSGASDLVLIEHARTTSTISSSLGNAAEARKARYMIVDSIEALSKFGQNDEAWDRVVCVMTTGQEWQFGQYKWKEPKELFHHVKGFYVQWVNDAPNLKVRSWNVTELRIDPSKRHIDKSTVADFWRTLEAWIALNKPSLAY